MQIFSIGYEKKSPTEFCDILAGAGVRLLVDVRAAAWSQRPQFRREALRAALAANDIEYVHCKFAGNPFRPRPGQSLDFGACRAEFARHVAENPTIIRDLTPYVLHQPAALFCYESTRFRCHRGVLLDALVAAVPDLRVVDLGVDDVDAQASLFGTSAN